MPAAAQAEAQNFAGKTIRIIVPFKPGGGTDIWARFWAPRIASKIPGNPYVDIINIPGGGSTEGANQFAEDAGKDGLTILASSASVLLAYLLGDPRVNYDYKEFRALLASPTNAVVYTKAGMVDTEDPDALYKAARLPWKMHLQSPNSIDMIRVLSLEVLRFGYEVDFGAEGGADTFRSFREGLYNIDMQTTPSYLANVAAEVERGTIVPLFTLGTLDPSGSIGRDEAYPDIPTLNELYYKIHSKPPYGHAFEVWKKFFLAGFSAQKMLVIPRDTDPTAVKVLESALRAAIKDRASWSPANKTLIGNYRQSVGRDADDLMQDAITVDPEVLSWYQEFVKYRFDHEL